MTHITKDEYDIRGMLAFKLTCWHRLRETEANELVALVVGLTQPAPVQEPVAWREFDGEGGYDYYTYEHNENLRDKYIERNGEKYASWVEPLYTTPPTAQQDIQRLSALVRAQQITIDKLEAQQEKDT